MYHTCRFHIQTPHLFPFFHSIRSYLVPWSSSPISKLLSSFESVRIDHRISVAISIAKIVEAYQETRGKDVETVSASQGQGKAYTTICLRAKRGLRMNLRVRKVIGPSAMMKVIFSDCRKVLVEKEQIQCFRRQHRKKLAEGGCWRVRCLIASTHTNQFSCGR